MARKLTTLLFSTAKSLARLQRAALGLGRSRRLPGWPLAPGGKARRKPAAAKATPKPAAKPPAMKSAAAGQPAAVKRDTGPSLGKGTWKELVHRTLPIEANPLGRIAYSLYLPLLSPPAGLPLVVMLHGCQQTAGDFAMGTRMNVLADAKGFVVAYPQQSLRAQSQRCWRWFRPLPAYGASEADAIASLIRTLVTRLRVDPARVYVAGLSAGAGMAALVAVRHPDLVAAVGLHSGPVTGDAQNAIAGLQTMRRGTLRDPIAALGAVADVDAFPGMPAIILQGERDPVVGGRNAAQLTEQFLFLNGLEHADQRPAEVLAAGTARQYQRIDFRKAGVALVRVCRVERLGHGWSGGDARVKFHAREGPHASSLMWQFFATHRRVAGVAAARVASA